MFWRGELLSFSHFPSSTGEVSGALIKVVAHLLASAKTSRKLQFCDGINISGVQFQSRATHQDFTAFLRSWLLRVFLSCAPIVLVSFSASLPIFVRMVGLEPTRDFSQRILSPLCLPIPPHSHV